MANNKSQRWSARIVLLGMLAVGLLPEAVHGADFVLPQDLEAGAESHDRSPEPESALWDLKFQATYIRQEKFGFDAPYTGPNSLSTTKEKSYSLSATAYLGIRAWTGGEFYLNAEMLQGVAFSNLQGMGGFTNAEPKRWPELIRFSMCRGLSCAKHGQWAVVRTMSNRHRTSSPARSTNDVWC